LADIFISYAHADRPWVETLAAALEARGFSVWWDPSLVVGTRYRDAIRDELRAAKAVVVVWSQTSIESDWVRDEADEAKTRKILVPVSRSGVRPPHGFGQLQTCDLTGWPDAGDPDAFPQLLKALGVMTGQTTPPLPRPSRNTFSPLVWIASIAGIVVLAALFVFLLPHRAAHLKAPPRPVRAVSTLAALRRPSRQSFRDCANCPELIAVPSGKFRMGSVDPRSGADEHDLHEVTIARPFAIGKFDVTFDEWTACVADGACNRYKPDDEGWGRDDRPVINVNWEDARAFLKWLSRKTGHPYRLLSEAEYEYAARAGTTTLYYWGNVPGNGNALCGGCITPAPAKKTLPVGRFAPNPFGLYDISGNVWSWTEDCYVESYKSAPVDGSAIVRPDCHKRVIRGGAWSGDIGDARTSDRNAATPDTRSADIGFRVARDL
jgi:formylglycine-generating enzyme required for sulfatase activity